MSIRWILHKLVRFALIVATIPLCLCGCKEKSPPVGPPRPPSSAEGPGDAEPPPSPPLQIETLASQTLTPSDSPQAVAYGDRVKVIVPGGLLKDSRKVTISAVKNPPPPNYPGTGQVSVFDISIDGLSTLDRDLVIELPYAPSDMEKDFPASALTWVEYYEPAMGAWFPARFTLDPERKVAVVQTRHLSPYAVLSPAGGGDYKLWVCEEDEKSGERAPLLVFHYNDAEIRKSTILFKNEELQMELVKRDGDILHGYLAKLAEFAQETLATYRGLGLEMYAKPLHIFVGNSRNVPSSYHNEWTGNICFNTSADTLDTLRYAIAHEMFHSVQRNYYWPQTFPFNRSWLEATAEYAASRVAMPGYRYWGKLDKPYRRQKLTTYLTKDLTYARARPVAEGQDPWANHEYAAAYFINQLCVTGAEQSGETQARYFAEFFKSVAAEGDWGAVDGVLVKKHTGRFSMGPQYAAFAANYLLGSRSPMYFAEELNDNGDPVDAYRTSGPVDASALDASYSLAEDGKGQVHHFGFDENWTSRIIKCTAATTQGGKWFATVEAPETPQGVWVSASRLPKDNRGNGAETKILPNPPESRPEIHVLERGDALYVVASSEKAGSMVDVMVTALALEETPLKSSASIAVGPKPWGKAGCNLKIECTGRLTSSAAMRKYVTEDASHTGYKHVQILSPNYMEPTEVSVSVEFELSKGPKYRHEDTFDFGSGYVEMIIGNPRLEAEVGSDRRTLSGLSGSVRIPVVRDLTPSMQIYLVMDVTANFHKALKDGEYESVKSESAKMSFLVVDLHGGGF